MAYTTINKSTDHFNTVLYTGNGTDNRAVTGVGFQPDWLWIKDRSSAFSHALFDVIRGSSKMLASSSTDAEQTNASSGGLTSFDADGFTTDAGSGGNPYRNTNQNGDNYVSWNWKAGGSGSSNTDGSITSTVSANTTAGFSIVSYTGTGANATVGHGLGVTPEMFIIKDRTSGTANDWFIYNKNIGATKYLRLNDIGGQASSSTLYQDTDPTSSVFSIGTNGNINTNGNNYIAYCFAEKKGYSKFGSYTGNGNADGTFVYLGFKPAVVIFKTYTTNGGWQIYDNKRNNGNPTAKFLVPSSNAAEASGSNDIDFLSNGFKTRTTNNPGTTDSFIYMAFAEAPLVGSNNVPCTAN
tara:strand:- start:45 stop:1103 length:1059 start_codon:yes stop_codon:yes gene_type:complete